MNKHCPCCGAEIMAGQEVCLILPGVSVGGNLMVEMKWIPVSERLPEDDRQVLACTKKGKAFSAHYDHKWKSWSVSHTVKITHWMPLPEPPDEDGIIKVETNMYDKEETFPNCTVQVLTNTATGETSVGWWKNGN